MRKLLFLILFPGFLFSQDFSDVFKTDDLTQEVYYENIHVLDSSVLKAPSKVVEWVAIYFNDSNNVLKFNTDQKTVVKGLFKISYESFGVLNSNNVDFDMIVSYKPNKYRIQLKNIEINTSISPGNNIKTPLASYINSNFTFESYKKQFFDLRDNATDNFTRKTYDNILKNEDQMLKDFEAAKSLYLSIFNQVKEKCISIDKSLYSHLKGALEKDKW